MTKLNFNFGSILFKSLMSGLGFFLKLIGVFIIPILVVFIIILILTVCHYIKFRYIDHIKPIKRKYKPKSNPGVLKKLFYLFPKALAHEYLTQNPDAFGEFGIHMCVGEQGAGKTITAVYLLEKWRNMYPQMKIYTNMEYKYEDGQLTYWQDLMNHENDIYGVINCIDEIKTWWSNRENKDVPVEILGEICQQRKQKKAIVGTVQVFSELAKSFRSQTHFIYIPKTFFNCFTIVFKSKAKWYDSEHDRFRRTCGFFFFVHTKELREAYDTYKKIEKYKDIEFSKETTLNSSDFESCLAGVQDISKPKK